MSDVPQWSVTAAANTAAPPDGWPEGMNRPTVNNCGREVMAALARLYRDLEWGDFWADSGIFTISKVSDQSFKIIASPASDQRDYFPVGSKVKVSDTITPTHVYGYVTGTSYAAGTGTTTIAVSLDSGVVPAGTDACYAYVLRSIRESAFTLGPALTQGRQTASVPAGAMSPMSQFGCLPIQRHATTGNNPEIIGLEFQDSQKATGRFVFDGNPSNGEWIGLNGQTWTFTTAATASSVETKIAGTLTLTMDDLFANLNASTSNSVNVASYSKFAAVGLDIEHDSPGVTGNAYTIDDDGVMGVDRSGSVLAGGTDEQYCTFAVEMPKSYDGGDIQMQLRLARFGAATTFVTQFGVAALAMADGDDFDQAFGTASLFDTVSLTTAEKGYLTPELTTAITPAGGPDSNTEMVIFRLYRNPKAAGDTLDANAILVSARVYPTWDLPDDD